MLGQAKAARAVAIMVVGAALASGCQTDRKITEPDPVPVTADLLTDALLTADDVPDPYVVAEDHDQVGPELIPEHSCDDKLKDLDPEESAQVVFTGAFTTLTNTISYFPGQGAAVVDVYNKLLTDCDEAVVNDEHLRFTTKPLNFGVLSDNTLPLVVSLERDNGKIDERNLIIMRQGDLISTIRLDGPRPSDKVLMDTVTRVAIGNLGALAQDTT